MPSISDKISDRFIRHAVNLGRFEAGTAKKALRLLNQLERDLVAQLASNDPTGPTRTAFQQARLDALLSQTRATITKSYGKVKGATDRDLRGLAEVESDFTKVSINGSVGAAVMSVSVPETTLKHIAEDTLIEGAPSKAWWQKQAGDLQMRFGNQMRAGMMRGETVDELARRVRGMKQNGYVDGIMQLSRSQAKTLVRASVQAVSNAAREETFRANSDVVKGFQHLSTLDGRTTPICIAYSGGCWDLDGDPLPESPVQLPDPGIPPLHWGCRSTRIAILKSLDELLGDVGPRKAGALGALSQSTQSSMDGQVAGDLTYEQWLEGKDEPFQRQVLGAGKWELWQSGKLSLTDLVDQSGRPMTLAQLREAV